MSPRCATRIVTILFLVALEILTIKLNVNAYVIKQDPQRLAAVMAELEQLGVGTGGSKDDVLSDKKIDIKHNGTSQSIAPIETTAKTEEIQKSSPETTSNEPETTISNKAKINRTVTAETSPTKIPETTTNGKLDTITTNKPQQSTSSEVSYTDNNPKTYVPIKTTIDFLLDNTETESNGDASTISSTTAKVREKTERNILTSYSTEAVQTDTNALSDASSTAEIEDDSRRNMPNVTDITLSTTLLTTPTSQNGENTVISTTSTASDMLTTDVKPLQKKYIILDRKRNNMKDEGKLNTTKKETKLVTAETKYQNHDSNGATVSTPEWYYVNAKQDTSFPMNTDSLAIPYDTNSINENQSQPTTGVVTDKNENIVSPLLELPKNSNSFFTEIVTEGITVNKYNSGLNNVKISQSSQDLHVTNEDATNTDIPNITTEFMTTTDITKNPTTTEISTLEAKTDQIISTSDVSSLRSPRAYNETEVTKSAESVRGINEITIETTKSVLTSKRAGYLNMSSKPSSRTETTTANERKTMVTRDAKTTTPVTEPVMATDRKVYYMQSQSQLAEDAINEELMKEEMMNDQIGYTPQNREQRKDKALARDITTEKAPTTTDDILSVKPIGVEKQKNSSLYTVSPNYKPLKKIEVQPPKTFVRDPDDNSWRNESLSSLGIVFKANNSSKPLTQVLKNKTETELNSLLDKYGKPGEPELRTRLEKIAEQRKTKKRVGEKSGEISYTDSEEVQNFVAESSSMSTPEFTTVEVVPSVSPIAKPTIAVSSSTTVEPDNFVKSTISIRDREDPSQTGYLTASPPKKYYESFDGSDEEPDYSSLSNIDIKKTSVKKIEASRNKIGPIQTPIPPERKATVQYFPPRGTQPAKVNLNDYDYDFKRKIHDFEQDKRVSPLVYTSAPTPAPITQGLSSTQRQQTVKDFRLTVTDIPGQKFTNVFTSETPQTERQDGFDGASYVIKHLRDFIHLAAKESEEERVAYLTEPSRVPVYSATTHGYLKDNKVKSSDYQDYDSQFRKEVLDRFVENFNHNSERFKIDFPVLYNTSIIHSNFADESKQASSSAFMKRLHGTPRVSRERGAGESGCDHAVELTPEYELHYYVPDQEEREVAHSDQLLSPVRYRLRL